MGPIIIFDKSVLESLDADEAVWLDSHYTANITPLFFIETLADLEKEVRKGRTPEQLVGSLANKTPEQGKPNVHHRTLLEGELTGAARLDMRSGRPHISGGRALELGGKLGVVFEESSEEEAFRRWKRSEFLDLERLRAKAWRQALSGTDFEGIYRGFQRFFPLGRPKGLTDVKRVVDFHLSDPDQESVLRFGLTLHNVVPKFQEEIVSRWKRAGRSPLQESFPYFAHVLSVDLFFYLGIAADLIARSRPSHMVDLAYLYYLPFCMVFTSNDKLHREIVPFFLRKNQSYVAGTELKDDLARLDAHYCALPDEVKSRGVMTFATFPPHDTAFLTTRLWDRHMAPNWRDMDRPTPPLSREMNKKIVDEIHRLEKEGVPVPDDARGHGEEPQSMLIKRTVRGRRGKWIMLPPEVLDRGRNRDGEPG